MKMTNINIERTYINFRSINNDIKFKNKKANQLVNIGRIAKIVDRDKDICLLEYKGKRTKQKIAELVDEIFAMKGFCITNPSILWGYKGFKTEKDRPVRETKPNDRKIEVKSGLYDYILTLDDIEVFSFGDIEKYIKKDTDIKKLAENMVKATRNPKHPGMINVLESDLTQDEMKQVYTQLLQIMSAILKNKIDESKLSEDDKNKYKILRAEGYNTGKIKELLKASTYYDNKDEFIRKKGLKVVFAGNGEEYIWLHSKGYTRTSSLFNESIKRQTDWILVGNRADGFVELPYAPEIMSTTTTCG